MCAWSKGVLLFVEPLVLSPLSPLGMDGPEKHVPFGSEFFSGVMGGGRTDTACIMG